MDVARNAPCPCGSGQKYKNCCAGKSSGIGRNGAGIIIGLVLLVGVLIAGAAVSGAGDGPQGEGAPGQVWSEEHGHWH
ncbi:SEC-C metal-binding domain-containing protein [Rubricoccus marinus]|uniref:Zinc chelation protein SecC n=1 Tax=Rubricoccus marinus TaxID=716817 RepID=A0A259U1D6_9BACT|nr:SEC-C metal-binding domain-containing protein [Rubricoccus marinus]OZC03845.1 hypothetical protein BSZ36_13125 [Rubricoccus marinus]